MEQKKPAVTAEGTAGRLQWHPAFSSAFQIELKADREELKISVEYQLTRKPLIMDVLVIKKTDHYRCKNKIAEFFKRHNIVEYKSPQDSYGMNDLFKTLAYAAVYQSNTEKETEIDPMNLTVTVVCGRFPHKLMHKLKEIYGIEYHVCEPGIYRTDQSILFPVQFVVNTRLNPEKFKWLSRLRSDLTVERDVEVLAREYRGKEKDPLYETAMDVIMRANKEVYREAKDMCQALRELFAEELEERENKGMEKGMERGMERGMELMSRLLADGRIADAQMAASDAKSRRRFYEEYGIAL